MLQPLFAPKATLENYAVIFLAHSNWTKSKKNKLNVIQEQTIEERWEIVDNNDFYTDHYTRVVFAKNPSCKGNYVFLGVYEYKDTKTETYPNGQTLHVKIYNRISDVYPF